MDFKDFKRIIDNVNSPEEFEEVTQRMDITPEELARFNELYNKQYEPELKEMRKKERKYAIIIGIIWIALFQLLIVYLAVNRMDIKESPGIILFGIWVIGGIFVLCYNSWRLEKKFRKRCGLDKK